MQYTCPKCGKHIDLSVEALIANEYKTICPQCLTQLEIVGDYAYVPLDDGSFELRRDESQPVTTPQPPVPGQVSSGAVPVEMPAALPSQLGGEARDPLFDEAVSYLSQCNAITPVMLRDYFSIPLERAQDLLGQLERAGCVGPYRGGAPRQILIDHREGLPSPYQSRQRYDPNARSAMSEDWQPDGRKVVSVNCGSCLIWLVLIAFLIFLLVK